MVRLRLLNLNYVQLMTGYEQIISRRLVLLCWKGFPLDCMPLNLHMENLVYLDLSYSGLKYVWIGTKILDKLKFLHLNHCSSLIKTPDFSGLSNLLELSLNDCTSLVEVGESISCLNKIVVLDMKNCNKLKKLPFGIWMMKSLKCLDLSGCSNLRNFAGFKGSPSALFYLFFSSWISPTRRVGSVDLQVAKSRLKTLRMAGCSLSYIPNEIGCLTSLQKLDISRNNFSILPDSIGDLCQLKCLDVHECRRLQLVPKLPPGLLTLYAFRCTSLESISMESNWKNLNGPKVLCFESPVADTYRKRVKFSIDLSTRAQGHVYLSWHLNPFWRGQLEQLSHFPRKHLYFRGNLRNHPVVLSTELQTLEELAQLNCKLSRELAQQPTTTVSHLNLGHSR